MCSSDLLPAAARDPLCRASPAALMRSVLPTSSYPAHIEVINGVEDGDAPPVLCRHDNIVSIAEVGSEVVKELDLLLLP